MTRRDGEQMRLHPGTAFRRPAADGRARLSAGCTERPKNRGVQPMSSAGFAGGTMT
jgi:hypothetical protein